MTTTNTKTRTTTMAKWMDEPTVPGRYWVWWKGRTKMHCWDVYKGACGKWLDFGGRFLPWDKGLKFYGPLIPPKPPKV